MGFLSFFPPMVILCLVHCITLVSAPPGCVTRQPATARQRQQPGTAASALRCICLLLYVDLKSHGAVATATEASALAAKVAGFIGSNGNFLWMVFRDLFVYAEFFDDETVRHIIGDELDGYGFTFLESDLRG